MEVSIMFLGNFKIKKHALEMYRLRAGLDFKNPSKCARDLDRMARKLINKDLRTMNIKKIIYKEECIHVFTYGYKEFVFSKPVENNKLDLITYIARNEEDTIKRINKLITR
jgi:hypothetical protein